MRKSLATGLISALNNLNSLGLDLSFPYRIFGNPSRSVRKTSGIRKNVYGGQLYGIREANSRNGVGSGIRRKRDAVLKAAAEYYGRPLTDNERAYVVSEFQKRQANILKKA